MGELLLRKAILCRDRIGKITAALPAAPEEIRNDERNESFVTFQLFLLIQDLIDLGAHLIAARGLGVPASHRELFEILTKAGLITAETAPAIAALASLRNRIARSYGDLDPVRLAREAPRGLEWAGRFLDELADVIGAPVP